MTDGTRNAWQSLAYSPLGAAVSPPIASSSKQTVLPSGERAKNARTISSVVNINYTTTISLPLLRQLYLVTMQRPLTNW